MISRPLVILSDPHLAPRASPGLVGDLASLIRAFAGHEIVLNGDTFTLSADPNPADPLALLDQVLAEYPALTAALRDHLARGDALTLVAGNHDAALGLPSARARVLGALGLPTGAPLSIAPWFVRRHGLHIEHGHVYDPDNAPAHPLGPWSRELEPLGVMLNRRLIVPFGVESFAHAHETTPLEGLVRALRHHGLRALTVIAGYFALAIDLVARAGKRVLDARRNLPPDSVSAYGDSAGLTAEQMVALFAVTPLPTHHSRWATFRRLYLDRALACSCVLGGAAAMVATPGAALISLGGGLYLLGSVFASGNRYQGLTEKRLRSAAQSISIATSARSVVFGHSHVSESSSEYWNTGCFAHTSHLGRAYLLVDVLGRPSSKFWPPPALTSHGGGVIESPFNQTE